MSSITSSSVTTPPTTRARARSRAGSVSANGANGLAVPSSPVPPMPSPNATHSSLIPTSFIKHASLINSCYPSRPDEKGPKSSELSYLVYYATSKPEKLTKVGTFIERRVVKDYRKKRFQDVHCSLDIIKALLLESKAHLNIYSKNVVNILDVLLVDISDFDIVRHCQSIFSCFCAAHDGSTLGVDIEFKSLYSRVVARSATIATFEGDNSNRYRMIGLRALEAVVSSSALYASDSKGQLDLVLPAILDGLIDATNGVQIELEDRPDPVLSVRRSVSIHATLHPDNMVTDDDVTAEALRCLCALFKTPNGNNVKLALGPTFSYLDEHSRWWPSTFGVGIIKAIVSSILPQNRYMVVNEIIARIDSVDSTTPDLTLRLQKRATLISALEAILVSSISLAGMPVLEVLNSLLVALTKSLSASASMTKEDDSSQLLALEAVIQEGLVKSVGGLATHIYYSNQVPHIISHIVGKLSFKAGASSQPSTIEGVPAVEYRGAMLKCLLAVIKTSKESGRQEASFHSAEISSDLLTPCLGLLLDNNVEIRTGFAQTLVTFLVTEDESVRTGTGSRMMTTPIPSTSGDLYFRAAAHQALHVYASSSSLTPKDLVAIYGVLKAMFVHFQDDEFIRVVPMLFSLQDWCLQEQSSEGEDKDVYAVSRKRAVAAAIVAYFQMAVGTYDMAEPKEYLENIKSSRVNESQWIPIEYTTINESLAQTESNTWEVPSDPLSPVLTHPLAREHLVTLLTTVSDRFRAGADRFGLVFQPESQSTLLSARNNNEFGSGLFLSTGTMNGAPNLMSQKSERNMDSRIRVSRHLEDWALPKIISNLSNLPSDTIITEEATESIIARDGSVASGLSNLGDGSMTQRKIGVASLKAALAAAQSATDAASDAGSSSAGSESRATSTVQPKFYPLSVHAQTLRKKHGATASSMSTTSTLAASRPDLADLLNTIKVNNSTSNGSRMSLAVPPY
ncbi:plasma membrane localization protein [Mortierella polycephala]|uniref:Plasma membrane localization protein n=1 Tax=Mortierella polycephala TaxID=41804 RepID=A0A9P6U297_9FUNG|nr:plasma membrane localization protein [Mortierella polycephala]